MFVSSGRHVSKSQAQLNADLTNVRVFREQLPRDCSRSTSRTASCPNVLWLDDCSHLKPHPGADKTEKGSKSAFKLPSDAFSLRLAPSPYVSATPADSHSTTMCFPPPERFSPSAIATLRAHDDSQTHPDKRSFSSDIILEACLEDKLRFLEDRRRTAIESCERFLNEIDDAMRRETGACVPLAESRLYSSPARRQRATRRSMGYNQPEGDVPFEATQKSESARFTTAGAFTEGQRHELTRRGSLSSPLDSDPVSSPWFADLSYYRDSFGRRKPTTGTTGGSSRVIGSSSSSRSARASTASFSSPSQSSRRVSAPAL